MTSSENPQQLPALPASRCWAPSSFLVCCEHSGMVREALRAKGVDAWSCDLLPADDASPYHIQGDCRDAMRSREWGGYGMHPDCTYLTVAGIHWNNRGRGWEKTDAALAFVRELIELAGDKPWYLENPVSIISTKIRKPTQTIQPYDFGEDASKRTCLWLNRLPPLKPTKRVLGRVVNGVERWANQTDSGQNKLAPSADRWKLRSKTYPGVAAAMADQWAPLLLGWKQVCSLLGLCPTPHMSRARSALAPCGWLGSDNIHVNQLAYVFTVKHTDKIQYEKLGSITERAAWLLKQGGSASLDIDTATLAPVWRVSRAGVMLPQKFIGTEAESLRDAEAWLLEKAGLPNVAVSHAPATSRKPQP